MPNPVDLMRVNLIVVMPCFQSMFEKTFGRSWRHYKLWLYDICLDQKPPSCELHPTIAGVQILSSQSWGKECMCLQPCHVFISRAMKTTKEQTPYACSFMKIAFHFHSRPEELNMFACRFLTIVTNQWTHCLPKAPQGDESWVLWHRTCCLLHESRGFWELRAFHLILGWVVESTKHILKQFWSIAVSTNSGWPGFSGGLWR